MNFLFTLFLIQVSKLLLFHPIFIPIFFLLLSFSSFLSSSYYSLSSSSKFSFQLCISLPISLPISLSISLPISLLSSSQKLNYKEIVIMLEIIAMTKMMVTIITTLLVIMIWKLKQYSRWQSFSWQWQKINDYGDDGTLSTSFCQSTKNNKIIIGSFIFGFKIFYSVW